MKKIVSAIVLLAMMLLCLSSCGNADLKGVEKSDEPTNFVLMKVKGYGYILIELYPDIAPDTVINFKNLVSEGFYNGLTFHRTISGFMIQGGDPDGNGTGGSETTIKGEFAANGIQNDLKHDRGVISMARSNDMNSASSQFFIMHQDSTGLNGKYAAFGKVVYGMDTVDAIANVPVTVNPVTGEKSYPINPVVIKWARCVSVEGTAFERK